MTSVGKYARRLKSGQPPSSCPYSQPPTSVLVIVRVLPLTEKVNLPSYWYQLLMYLGSTFILAYGSCTSTLLLALLTMRMILMFIYRMQQRLADLLEECCASVALACVAALRCRVLVLRRRCVGVCLSSFRFFNVYSALLFLFYLSHHYSKQKLREE